MKITVVRGDITKQEGIDAVVNAAHCSLLGGGGVDGAIHRAAGPQLLAACEALPVLPPDDVGEPTRHIQTRDSPSRSRDVRCEVGEAVVTEGFGVARWVVHTVGPLFPGRPPEESHHLLALAYENSLRAAHLVGARSIAFPGISVGVFGFPMREAAEIAVRTVEQFLNANEGIEKVVFVAFDPAWEAALNTVMG